MEAKYAGAVGWPSKLKAARLPLASAQTAGVVPVTTDRFPQASSLQRNPPGRSHAAQFAALLLGERLRKNWPRRLLAASLETGGGKQQPGTRKPPGQGTNLESSRQPEG